MREKKGMGGVILLALIGIILFAIFVAIVIVFYGSDSFGSLLAGLRNALPFQSQSGSGVFV